MSGRFETARSDKEMHGMKTYRLVLCVAVYSFFSTYALASSVTIPNTFVADTPAVASQVNGNFAGRCFEEHDVVDGAVPSE